MFCKKFQFGGGAAESNVIMVSKDNLYEEEAAFGFVTEANRRKQPLLQIPELNAGFDTVYWYQSEIITKIRQDEKSCFLEKENPFLTEERRIPLCFKMQVPRQGNYLVTITICPGEDMRDILIFAGRRRLAAKKDYLKANQIYRQTILVNICDIVPRGKTRIYNDKTLDIAVVADYPCISSLEIREVSCPTIYIAGDSTVTDQSADYPYSPGTSYAGWGQMLTAFLSPQIGVSNHSHSGLTTESFRREGHYAVIDQYSRQKDYFFFQFGHNDQKLTELKAREGYLNNLAVYIGECREIGAFPLIVTPVARNSWKGNDGSYNDLLSEYAQACVEIGQEMDVPVIELHKKSMEFIQKSGLENAKKYFYPGDFTHNNDYGAYLMAEFVAEEIIRVCSQHSMAAYRQLAAFVTEGFGEWQPPEEITLLKKPEGYQHIPNPDAGEELLTDIENPKGKLLRAEALDFIIKMARFFPTNVYNDMFDDVVGHEWYAGAVECAYQNGIILPGFCDNKHFYPEREVTMEEFLALAMNGYQSRKLLPKEKPCCYDGNVKEENRSFVRAACLLGIIDAAGKEEMQAVISRERAAQICRNLNV